MPEPIYDRKAEKYRLRMRDGSTKFFGDLPSARKAAGKPRAVHGLTDLSALRVLRSADRAVARSN